MSKVTISFPTKFTKVTAEFISENGSKLLAEYAMKVDEKTGYEYLAKTGEYTNVYDKIQADYPSTDINLLMERFALGETDVLDVRPGMYFDATGMPKTYAELFQRANDTHRFFDELPTDLKEMFGNSYTEFWSMIDSDPKLFNEKIAEYNKRFELSPEYNNPDKSDDEKGENE